MSFENTRFVIIGASGGIGSALSRRLKSHGAQPILVGRSAAKLAPLAEELGAQTRSLDASKADELEHAVTAFGPINGIVNCAGSILLKPAHLTTEAEWKQIIETNLTTAYATVKAGAKALWSTGGSIVLCATALFDALFRPTLIRSPLHCFGTRQRMCLPADEAGAQCVS